MGDLIQLEGARRSRDHARRVPRAELFFDLSCPFTYVVADRVTHAFPQAEWHPASASALQRLAPDARDEDVRRAAERLASTAGLPIVWPGDYPCEVPAAMRAASYATECGRARAFVLAASRLAFCGGFDLDDPEILAEAAAAAGMSLIETLHAAGDTRRDGPIEAAGRRLLAVGADRLPALRVGRTLMWGADRVASASTAAVARPVQL